LILDTDELNKHRGKVKLVKVDNTEKMENWANRISMTGLVQNIKYSGTELSSIETSLKTLRIPEFVYINIFAFDRASIKDLIVSSDNTVILPRYYRNSDDKIINITYENNHSAAFSSYSLDSFRNSLIQTLLLNSSWQAINIAEQLGGLDYGIEVF
jgi:hypothetical protein